MLLQVLLVCVLANALLVESSDNVIASVLRPRSLSPDAHDEKIRQFWTHERLKAAKPIDITLPNLANGKILSTVSVTTGPPSRVAGSIPLNSGTLSKAISSGGRQVYTTGRVFWQVGTWLYSCSASVVTSKSTDLIVTAAHCVYDTTAKTWYNNNNWMFIPAYSNNAAPYGTWPARNFLLKQAWISSADYNSDVAFVALSPLNGRHIQSVVGSQGIGFNQPRLANVYSFGYPANLDSGLYLKSCAGYTQASKYTQNGFVGQGLPCNMGHGCSGGPWLQNVVDATGVGYITAVNSFMITNLPNIMNGPYFETNIYNLYNQASSM